MKKIMIMLAILTMGMVSAQVYDSRTISGTTYTWDSPVVTDGTTSWTAIGDYIAGLDDYFRVVPTVSVSGSQSVELGHPITFTANANFDETPVYRWYFTVGADREYEQIGAAAGGDGRFVISGDTNNIMTFTPDNSGWVDTTSSIRVEVNDVPSTTQDFTITRFISIGGLRTSLTNNDNAFTTLPGDLRSFDGLATHIRVDGVVRRITSIADAGGGNTFFRFDGTIPANRREDVNALLFAPRVFQQGAVYNNDPFDSFVQPGDAISDLRGVPNLLMLINGIEYTVKAIRQSSLSGNPWQIDLWEGLPPGTEVPAGTEILVYERPPGAIVERTFTIDSSQHSIQPGRSRAKRILIDGDWRFYQGLWTTVVVEGETYQLQVREFIYYSDSDNTELHITTDVVKSYSGGTPAIIY